MWLFETVHPLLPLVSEVVACGGRGRESGIFVLVLFRSFLFPFFPSFNRSCGTHLQCATCFLQLGGQTGVPHFLHVTHPLRSGCVSKRSDMLCCSWLTRLPLSPISPIPPLLRNRLLSPSVYRLSSAGGSKHDSTEGIRLRTWEVFFAQKQSKEG